MVIVNTAVVKKVYEKRIKTLKTNSVLGYLITKLTSRMRVSDLYTLWRIAYNILKINEVHRKPCSAVSQNLHHLLLLHYKKGYTLEIVRKSWKIRRITKERDYGFTVKSYSRKYYFFSCFWRISYGCPKNFQ